MNNVNSLLTTSYAFCRDLLLLKVFSGFLSLLK